MLEPMVGQVYASTHRGDVVAGLRQDRTVVRWEEPFVYLSAFHRGGRASRIRCRRVRAGWVVPGHKLVATDWHVANTYHS